MKLEKFEVGYNIPAKVGMNIKDVQTPSLIIDYKIFEMQITDEKENSMLTNSYTTCTEESKSLKRKQK